MEKPLEELSASTLRNVLIEEIKKFILSLDHGSIAELEQMKLRLRRILDLLLEKEQDESPHLIQKSITDQAFMPDNLFER
jgi:hypothetical protein